MVSLTKKALRQYVKDLPDDAIICPSCRTAMSLGDNGNGKVYICPNKMCLNEEAIPVTIREQTIPLFE